MGSVVAYDRASLDLTDVKSLRRIIRQEAPSIIVNAAAYTAVDHAETEPELALAINGTVPCILAEEAHTLGALLVHYSTDYVFDGTSITPYTENCSVNPLNAYGISKLAGEQAIQSITSNYLILRTSWVYGRRGHNFLGTMMRLGKEKTHLRIVDDQVGAPTWSRHIAESTGQLIARYAFQKSPGIYHLSAMGETSWYAFAAAIYEILSRDSSYRAPHLTPISSEDYPLPAKRPRNSVLSNEKIFNQFGIQIPHWQQGLEFCLH